MTTAGQRRTLGRCHLGDKVVGTYLACQRGKHQVCGEQYRCTCTCHERGHRDRERDDMLRQLRVATLTDDAETGGALLLKLLQHDLGLDGDAS